MKISKNISICLATILFAVVTINRASAGCYKDCDAQNVGTIDTTEVQSQNNSNNTSTSTTSGSYNRDKSNNVSGHNESSVMGDMPIHIGHTNTTFGSVGDNSKVDNSISASFIFGGVHQ